MKTKHLSLTVLLLVAILLTACGPSAEEIATMTASAWTPTPVPPTITPSPTPVPYDLTVTVTDADGNPIAGASVVFPESGNGEPVAADDAGQVSWSNLGGPTGTLTVTAQGYLKGEQAVTLERGPNQVTVMLKRDAFAFLPSNACAAGESLLYMEDFQDGQTDMAHNEDGGAPVPLGPAVDEAGNTVLIHDFTTPVGDYSSYLTRGADGSPITFGDAVWRMRFMITKETNWGLGWESAGPNEFGGITTGESSYGIYFNTGRHAGITRSIWDANGQSVPNAGLGFVDKVLILKPNIWHYIEVSQYQGHLQVWLDGALALEVVDETPLPPGGFSIGGGQAGIMYFDAISVCGLSAPFTSMPAPVPAAAAQPAQEPVFVSAFCTMVGKPKETRIQAGSQVFLSWNWMATTRELVQLYIDKSITTVTFNGQEVTNAQMGQIEKLSDRNMYIVKWKADVGVLSPGTYEITYNVTWSEQITDGVDTYGPGGKYESLTDACTLVVE